MTEEFVDCFNCGRSNPVWAQVCRSCGVPVRHGDPDAPPATRFPTDQASLTSIAAVLGTIIVAVIVGLVATNVSPDRTPGVATAPTATPTATPEPTESATPEPSETPVPTPTATPGPPGTLAFGTGLDGDAVTGETDTFTRGSTFAHSITVPEPFGVNSIGEQVVRVAEDGTEEEVVRAIDNQLGVVPDATSAGFEAPADVLFEAFGPGSYILRVYAGTTLLAEGAFTLADE
jgi:hypothetical protein